MYYLLCISILTASVNSIFLKKAQVSPKNQILKFNLICALEWCIIFFIINKGNIQLNSQVLFWGAVYGLTQSLFILFKTAAMSNGSVSVTTLIGNSSLLISIFVSAIVWNDKISVVDVVGLIMLSVSLFMCIYKKTEETYTSKWKYYALFFLVFAALVGIVFKAFGKNVSLKYCDDMMFVSALVMLVCYFISGLFSGGFSFKSGGKKYKTCFVVYAIVCGVLSCLYNRLNIYLTANLNAIIFFPSFNGGVILVSALLSCWLCKEKITIKQATGILLGIVAICLIGML